MPLAPNTLPARAFQRATRTSRLLFNWRASDLSLTPVTGETPTFVRATGGGLVLDSRGYYRDVAQYQPRWDMSGYNAATGLWETPGLLLEGQRQNIILNSEDLKTTWVQGGGLVATPAYATHAGLSFTRCTNMTGVGVYNVLLGQAVTGSAVKAYSIHVRQDGTSAGTFEIGFRDGVDSTWYYRATVTVSAGGVVAVSDINGTTLAVTTLGDGVYRILARTVSVNAANVMTLHAVGSAATPTCPSVQLTGIQAEDAAYPSSYIKTTAAAVTRAADALSFPFTAVPQAMTLYCSVMKQNSGTQVFYAYLGDGAFGAKFLSLFEATNSYARYNGGGSTVDAVVGGDPGPIGTLVEMSATLSASGTVQLSRSVNSGAVEVGASVAGDALPTAWSAATIFAGVSGYPSYAAWRSIKVAPGVRTLAQMRSAF